MALRNTLVVGQVAVSFALLVIASMALRSLQYVSQVNPGFDTDNVLNVKLETAHKQMTPDQQERFLDNQLQGLRNVPGVLSATAASLGR